MTVATGLRVAGHRPPRRQKCTLHRALALLHLGLDQLLLVAFKQERSGRQLGRAVAWR